MVKAHNNETFNASNHYVHLIQLVFGIVIAQSLVFYHDIIIDPKIENGVAIGALVVVYLTTVLSWIGYHKSMDYNPYTPRKLSDVLRIAIDFFIVIGYVYLLFSITTFKDDPNINISNHLFGYPLIFLLYLLSGIFRVLVHGRLASKIFLNLIFWGLYLIVWLTYLFFSNAIIQKLEISMWIINAIVLAMVCVIMIIYRVIRSYLSARNKYVNQKKLNIGVDIDGVLANQITGILPHVNKKYSINLTYNDIKNWDEKVGDSNIKIEIESAISNELSYIWEMPLHEGAKQSIDQIRKNDKIYIITTRPKKVEGWTRCWLSRNDILYDSYINSRDMSKGNHNMDILIDDYIGNIKDFLSNPNGIAILFDQPWNKDRDQELNEWINKKRLFIVTKWKEIPSIVENLKT